MNDELKAAIINARCATTNARVAGMVAENDLRMLKGDSPAYGEAAFESVYVEEGVCWNSVCELINR